MQIQYDGSNYCGFSTQESGDGVEDHIFSALLKLNLIQDKKVLDFLKLSSKLIFIFHSTIRLVRIVAVEERIEV